ncbi:prepilin-type N-terminal cleavage/methylation domain-containing protein [Nitratifractor sp.]|uniref:prepilin-type N-terminal cleavage/methylation domain-containing protein n=1 Tax=Nitratifractor sp. TaxID=2268144 RepID=UPI0025D8E8C5|nr:prepilin-type N-terminal cleavage/methylation domain-containing protein [Nitratifractor sp.]
MRSGFTMIELIFAIVIIGILAAIAIPKLAATRVDARATQEVQNLSNYIEDIATHYMGTGIVDGNYSNVQLRCFDVNISEETTGERKISINITAGGRDNGKDYCTLAQKMAESNHLTGAAAGVTIGGNVVSY